MRLYSDRIWRAVPFPGSVWKEEAFWKSILWTDISNRIIWSQSKTNILGEKNLPPTVKRDGGDVKVWVCFSASAPEPLHFIQGTMNCPAFHQSPTVSQGGEAGMSVDYVSKQWPETFRPNYSRIGTLDLPSQSGPKSRSNVLAILFCPSNLSTGFWEEVLQGRVGKTPCLVEVMAAKGGATSY